MTSSSCDVLEKALKLVLDLEDAYIKADEDSENDFDRLLHGNIEASSSMASTRRLFGALLGGDMNNNKNTARKKSNSSRQQQNGKQNQRPDEDEAHQNVRKLWMELDEAVLALEKKCSKQEAPAGNSNNNAALSSSKMTADVFSGRVDKWVRLASSTEIAAERLRRRQQAAHAAGGAADISSRKRDLLPPEVVLGSSASSVARSIMHGVLTIGDDVHQD